MEGVKVSVVVPVYNVEKYLRDCLESVINQDFKEIEIICVNDGSKDDSQKILEEYSEKDSRIHIIVQENQGVSCARNVGIRCAKGEYICFLDSDDMLESSALKEIYEYAKSKQLDILHYDAECLYENDKLRINEYKDEYYTKKKSYVGPITGKEMFCQLIEADDYCEAAWLMFIRKQWLVETNICFEPNILYEDSLFCFQCFMETKRIEHIRKKYVKYRIRENSIMTSKIGYKNLESRVFCYRKVLEYLLNNELTKREKEAIVKYEKFLLYNIRWTDNKLNDDERRKSLCAEPIEKVLFMSMEIGAEREYGISERIYKRGFDELIKKSEYIVLYGAGKIGRKVYRYISKMGLQEKVYCFAVTERKIQPEEYEGVPVKEIAEIEKKDNVLVLVSARSDYQESMLENAIQMGFVNVEVIDAELEKIIDK